MSKPSDFIDSFTNFWSDVAMLKPTPSVKDLFATIEIIAQYEHMPTAKRPLSPVSSLRP
ncbi:predicted protein [Botrytis cinerea T4]|uniref:Uncharacterized protein n=1 Tax=Botryotinia fuckeliana (strain T4) TaxID=999810 RepID=G2YJ83_BOTF4|nr:predicted protein [Botrytis cinerea T4]